MKFITIISCLMLLMVSPLAADCSVADKKALEDFDRAWGDASRKGERAMLEQIYASDYMNLTPGDTQNRAGTIDGTVSDAEKARLSPPQPPVTHDYYIIQCTPNSASITHRNTITSTEDGKSHTSYSRSVHFLEKRSGKWQVVSNASHPLGAAGEVMYLEHEWNDADMKGDVAWFEKNFASDVTNISSRTGKLTYKSEELADFKARKGAMSSAVLHDLDVRTEGDTTIVTGINHVQGRDGEGKAYDRRVAFTDVWVKRDGRWQVLASQGTDMK
ncbi:MAG: nuclear transport factor 2 family protein [Thermoanaerobaculia bacterium]|nr:nuclear transport factor 2 family protein [Thermoanaerobaculia bacterium]